MTRNVQVKEVRFPTGIPIEIGDRPYCLVCFIDWELELNDSKCRGELRLIKKACPHWKLIMSVIQHCWPYGLQHLLETHLLQSKFVDQSDVVAWLCETVNLWSCKVANAHVAYSAVGPGGGLTCRLL
jgi:hypothetical protein